MIRLLFPNIEELKQLHYEAIKSYVADIMRKEQRKDFYQKVIDLPGREFNKQVQNYKMFL